MLTSPSIVRASRSDIPLILGISNRAAETTSANFATEPEPLTTWMAAWEARGTTHPWLVAKRDGEVLGFAKGAPYHPRGAYAWSADVAVYVEPAHAGQGIGTRLYQRLIPLMRAQGFVTLVAGITSPNPPSERLHASFGFTRCATFHRVGWKLGRWYDVAYWELHLRVGDDAPPALRTVDEAWSDGG